MGLWKLPQGALAQTADPRVSERLHFVEGGGMAWHEDLQNPLKRQVQGCMHVIPMLGRQRPQSPEAGKRKLAGQPVQPNQ